MQRTPQKQLGRPQSAGRLARPRSAGGAIRCFSDPAAACSPIVGRLRPRDSVGSAAPHPLEVHADVVGLLNEVLHNGTKSLCGRPIRDARTFFEALDRDRSGLLSVAELAWGFLRLSAAVGQEEVTRFLEDLAGEEGGQIDLARLAHGLLLGRSRRARAERPGGPPALGPGLEQQACALSPTGSPARHPCRGDLVREISADFRQCLSSLVAELQTEEKQKADAHVLGSLRLEQKLDQLGAAVLERLDRLEASVAPGAGPATTAGRAAAQLEQPMEEPRPCAGPSDDAEVSVDRAVLRRLEQNTGALQDLLSAVRAASARALTYEQAAGLMSVDRGGGGDLKAVLDAVSAVQRAVSSAEMKITSRVGEVQLCCSTQADLHRVLEAVSSSATVTDLRGVAQDLRAQQAVNLRPVLDAISAAVHELKAQPAATSVQELKAQPTVDLRPVLDSIATSVQEPKTHSVVDLRPVLDSIATSVTELKARPAVDLRPQLDAISVAVNDLKARPAVDLRPVLDSIAASVHELKAQPAVDLRQALDSIATSVHDPKAQPAVDLRPVLDSIATSVQELKAQPTVDLRPVLDSIATSVNELKAQPEVDIRPVLSALSVAVHELKARPAVDLRPELDAISVAVNDLKARPAVDLRPVLDSIATRATAADVVHIVQGSVTVDLDAKPLMDAISSRAAAADLQKMAASIQALLDRALAADLQPGAKGPRPAVDLQAVLDAISSRASATDLQGLAQDLDCQPVLDAIAASAARVQQAVLECVREALPVQAELDVRPLLEAIATRASAADVERVAQELAEGLRPLLGGAPRAGAAGQQPAAPDLRPVLDAIATRAGAAELERLARAVHEGLQRELPPVHVDVDMQPLLDAISTRATAADVRRAVAGGPSAGGAAAAEPRGGTAQ